MAERYIRAAKDGYVDLLRNATKRDLNTPDEDGMTATLWAAHHGNLEALRLIVGREGDVNKSDYQGYTALHHAARRGHMGVVSYLVHWGCNVFALDNDLHSAKDVAIMNDHHEIVKFLDHDLAQRKEKNPKQVSRQTEEAMKNAEINIKRYEKLTAMAAKRAEKEQRREQLFQQNSETGGYQKRGFFQTLTVRIKNGSVSKKPDRFPRTHTPRYSDHAGLTFSGKGSTIANKIRRRRNELLTPELIPGGKGGTTDRRSVRSLQGYVGSSPDVMYVTASKAQGVVDNGLGPLKRPALTGDFFQDSNLYRAKSESDLLDSGVDDYDHENSPGMFNRPRFGNLTIMSKSPFVNSLRSFDDSHVPATTNGMNGDVQPVSGEERHWTEEAEHYDAKAKQQGLPWDQDELGNLDDDEEADSSELSAVNMFLWSCGLASYLHIFSQEQIDMSLIMNMTDSELKELGLPFGPRKKLRDAVTRRKTVLQTPSKMTDTQL